MTTNLPGRDHSCVNGCTGAVVEEEVTETYTFGSRSFELLVPVMTCSDCDLSWTDDRAGNIRDEATAPFRIRDGKLFGETTH